MSDVNQGYLGDCYLAGPLASLAQTDPAALERMVHDNGDGTYTVTFHGPNGPVEETVDAKVYDSSGGGPLYGRPGGDGSIWFPIVEKAYAQYKGSYNDIGNGGQPSDTISALTGQSVSTGHVGGWGGMNDDACWNQIQNSVDHRSVITACTDGVSNGSGLVGDHCYSVIGYHTNSDGTRMVEVRNPWGSTPDPGGVGWMSVDDFRSQFATMQWAQ